MEWQESNSNARVDQEIGPFNRTLQDAPVQQVPYDWSAVGADNGTSPPAAVAQQPLSGTPYVAATQTVLSAPQAALSAVGLNVAQLCTANVVPGSVGHVTAACATLSNPQSVPTANGTGGPGHSPAVAPLRMHSACASNTRSWNASFSVADKPSDPGGMEAVAPPHLASSAAAEQQPALAASSAPTLDPMPQLMQQLAPTALAGLSALQPSLLPAAVAAAVPPPLQHTSAVAQAAAASQAALLQQLQRQLCNLPAAMVQAGLLPLLAQQPLPQRPNLDFAQQQSTPSSISTQQLLPAAVQREPSSSLQPQLGKATPASAGKAQVQHPAMPEFAEPSAAATVHVAAGSADGLSRSKRKAQLPADGSNGGIPERPSAAAAGSSAELPAMLPARLRKKIKIIQPISATWEEEALAKPAVAEQRHEASDAATKATAAAGSIAGVNKETDTGSGRIAADAEPRSGGLLGLDGQDTLLTRGSTNHDLVNGTGLMEQQLQSSRQQPSFSASKAAANGVACGDDADCAGAAGGPAVDYDGSSSGAGGLSSGAEGSGSDGGEVRASNSPKPTQQNSSQPQETERTPQQQQQQQEAQGTDGQAAGDGAVASVSAAAAEASTTPDTAANLKQAVVRLALPTPPPPASAAYSTGGVGAAKQATCRSHSPAAEGNAQIPRPSIAAAMSTAGLEGGQPTKTAQCSAAAAADGSEHAAAAGAGSTHQAPALHKRAAAVSISTAAASAAFGTADVLQTGIESQEAIAVTDWQAADAGNGNGIDVADGAKNDGDNVALSEQDSSEGESEGEEPNDDLEQQCQQQQLRDLGLPAAQQQVIRSPAGTLAAPAAAGAVPLVQGAAGVAGLNSSAAAAVLSNQLAAVQAILAAGLAGRQGMGILNQGLNLWSHVQGTGQAGLQGLGASAAAAAAAMIGTPAAAGNAATIPAAAAAPAAALQKDGSGPGAAPAAAVPALANAGLPPALAHLLGVSSNPSVHAAVAVGPTGVPDSPAANLAAVLQQLQNPVPPSSASDGPLNMSSVSAQLGMLYSWYASNRAAYLEQVQVLLQLAERDRLMAAALGPVAASAAARPPALRALDKALEIIRGSHALEQYCRTTSAATTTATTGSVGGRSHTAAAATGGGGGHPTARVGKVGKTTTAEPAAAAAGMSTDPLAPVSVIRPAAAAAAGLPQQTSAAPPGPGAAAAAAAAALAAMLQQANPATAAAAAQNLLSPAAAMTAAGTSPHALPGSTVNPMVQLQQQLLQHQQHLQAPLAQLQQAVLGSGVNPLLQLAQLARIQQQQQQQQQQAAALLAPLAALAATPGQQSAPMAAAAGGSALNMKQQLGLNNQLTHQQQQQQAPAVKAPGSSAATFNKMPQLPQPVAAAVSPAVLAAALANTPAGQTLPAAAGGLLQSKVGAATPAHMMAAAGGSGICGVPTDASKQAAHLSTAAAAPGVNGMLQGWANVAVHLPVPSPAGGGTTAAVATASAEAQQQHLGSANGRPPVPLVSKLGAATAAHQHQLTQSVAARAAAAAAVTAEASEAGQLKPA